MKWVISGNNNINHDNVIAWVVSGTGVTATLISGTLALAYPTDEDAQYAWQAIIRINNLPDDGDFVISDYLPTFAVGKLTPTGGIPTDVIVVTGLGFESTDLIWLVAGNLSAPCVTVYTSATSMSFTTPPNPFGSTHIADVVVIKSDGKTRCRLIAGFSWAS